VSHLSIHGRPRTNSSIFPSHSLILRAINHIYTIGHHILHRTFHFLEDSQWIPRRIEEILGPSVHIDLGRTPISLIHGGHGDLKH
jgi:hypothetical protein